VNPAPPRRALLLVPFALAGLLAVGAAIGPTSSTETRYCAMAREMLVSGDWIVPTFNGAPLLEKPPFEYWSTAASMAVLGVNDVAPRVPHLLAGLLVALVAAAVARRFAPEGTAGRWRGRLAFLALGTMPSFLIQSYTIEPDVWLVLSTTLAGWALLEADRATGEAGQAGKTKTPLRWVLLMHGALGFSMLVKGPLGLGLVFAAAAGTALIRRDARILRPFFHPLGVLLLAAVSVPWYLALDHWRPGFLGELVHRRLFGGLASNAEFHGHPVWVVWAPMAGALPWLAALPGAIGSMRSSGRWKRGPGLPAALIALAAPLLFTFSASRLASYGSPAYPWIAILVAIGIPSASPSADGDPEAAAPGARSTRVQLGRATIGMAFAAVFLALLASMFAIRGLDPESLRAADATVPVLVAAAITVAAVVFTPKRIRTFASPTRAAMASVLFLAVVGGVIVAKPSLVRNAKELWVALDRSRARDEPYAVFLNYNGDWGVLPWYSRADVPFFGYPSKEMMVPAEQYRPTLFRPETELVDWLRAPGRRWMFLRPRDRKMLVAQGIPLTVVAAAHEYEIVATKPLEPNSAPRER
jgi:4-amino-4-deoxy-L-arabinose transferase-like glycosyltransferase